MAADIVFYLHTMYFALRNSKMFTFLISVSIFIHVSAIRTGREEIVFPSVETLRSGEKTLSLRALNQDIELKLESAGEVFGDGFFVESIPYGNSEHSELNIHDMKQNLYKDKKTGASLHIVEDQRTLIKGILNHELRIEPVESVELGRREKKVPHRIYEIVKNDDSFVNDAIIPLDYHPIFNESMEELRSGEFIYVEVCVVTDVAFSHSFSTNDEIVMYLAILINGAQCRFDNIKSNRVVLIFSGLKIVRSASDEPYIRNNMIQNYVLAYDALYDFSMYMGKFKYSCDLIKLVTKQELSEIYNGQIETSLNGLAFIGTACDTFDEPNRTYKVGITEDYANCFEGVRTFAHEIAHILACPHDGDGSLYYLPDHPGSENCPWNHGFLMSYDQTTLNRYRFSSCSEENIVYLANLAPCLRQNNTGYNIKVSDRRPGEHMESSMGVSAFNYHKDKYFYYNHLCNKLHNLRMSSFKYPDSNCEFACRTDADKNGYFTYWIHRCSDGDMCDVGKRCLDGICR